MPCPLPRWTTVTSVRTMGADGDSPLRRVLALSYFLLLLPAVVGIRHALLEEQIPGVAPLPCDDSVLEYLEGSKIDENIIPYSTDCLIKYQNQSHFLRVPDTVALHLKGLPKTGTTWTEMVITELLQRICSSGIYKGCEHEHHYAVGHNREVHIFIPGQEPRDTSAAIVRFTVEFKHMITYNFTCDHLKGRETFREECKQLRIDRARNLVTSPLREKFHSRRGEEWKDCVYKGPYSQIQQCIPQYMHTAKYSWVADVGVMGLIGESFHYGHHVDLNRARRKYVMTLRDPRDSALSNAHYVSGRRDEDPNEYIMTVGCRDYITSIALFYYWQSEVQGGVYPTLPIWYRDALDDPVREVERILKHIGLRAPQEIIQQVVEASSAEAMREKEENGELPGANRADSAPKTRKAHYDTYLEEMNSTVIERCNSDMLRILPEVMLKKFGLVE